MTAVIGVLNKNAIALAADSAVTYSMPKGRKVLNTANKIFTLSKYHPVGIMIYNSATFVDVPWEVLIKEYRRQLKDQSFDTLTDCKDHFFSFLEKNLDFVNKDQNNYHLCSLADRTFKEYIKVALKNLELTSKALEAEKDQDKISEEVKALISKSLKSLKKSNLQIIPNLNDYSFKKFLDDNKGVIMNFLPSNILSFLKIEEEILEELLEIFYILVRSKQFENSWSGLVFVGFGEKELFPQCCATQVDGFIGNKIRYFLDEDNCASISNKLDSAIRPFAQTDVIETVLTGIDERLHEYYLTTFLNIFDQNIDQLSNIVNEKDKELAGKIKNVDMGILKTKLIQQIENYRVNNFVKPLMTTVNSLSKDDLADMAESLVYLTYLKRRMTSTEESVGGPIDVAVISKGDGFIWIKRKHYFEPELNTNYISNYLKL